MHSTIFRPKRIKVNPIENHPPKVVLSMDEDGDLTKSLTIHFSNVEELEEFLESANEEVHRLLNERPVALRLGPEQEVPANCGEAAP